MFDAIPMFGAVARLIGTLGGRPPVGMLGGRAPGGVADGAAAPISDCEVAYVQDSGPAGDCRRPRPRPAAWRVRAGPSRADGGARAGAHPGGLRA